jgi:hypothetical protein
MLRMPPQDAAPAFGLDFSRVHQCHDGIDTDDGPPAEFASAQLALGYQDPDTVWMQVERLRRPLNGGPYASVEKLVGGKWWHARTREASQETARNASAIYLCVPQKPPEAPIAWGVLPACSHRRLSSAAR